MNILYSNLHLNVDFVLGHFPASRPRLFILNFGGTSMMIL